LLREAVSRIVVSLDAGSLRTSLDGFLEAERSGGDAALTGTGLYQRFQEAVVRRNVEFYIAACPNAEVTVTVGTRYQADIWGEQVARVELDGEEICVVIRSANWEAWERLEMEAYAEASGR
jgi:hypothetical protein